MRFELDRKMKKKWEQEERKIKVLVGFDGFVDTIVHVVDKRFSSDDFKRISTIKQFAERIASAANLSANVEMVPQTVKLGGNGPLMANAFLSQNVSVSYIGALGKPSIHPIFQDFSQCCSSVVSLSEPGYTDALEFSDGKIMLGKLVSLQNINWKTLTSTIPENKISEMLSNKDLIAFTNWTMLPELDSIIIGIGELLKKYKLKPFLFFDLADPEKRSQKDILNLLDTIKNLNEFAPVILGLNERESSSLQTILKINERDIQKRAVTLREKLQLDFVVIHPTHGAAAADSEHSCWIDGPYTKNPKLTTGAGDHFNAGFCNGLLHGLSLEEALKIGVFTSGFYVREMHAPTIHELFSYTF